MMVEGKVHKMRSFLPSFFSMHRTFQNNESSPVGMRLPGPYKLDLYMFYESGCSIFTYQVTTNADVDVRKENTYAVQLRMQTGTDTKSV